VTATERIDKVKYQDAEHAHTREGTETELFLTGPAEFLCARVAAALLADPVWKAIFGEFIDPYKRMDYAIRNLPALRVYNNSYRKDAESWFINGQLVLDIILPASIRRKETEQLPDTLASALLQQFRRPKFFAGLTLAVPGLNELGKTVNVDKALAFELSDEELIPLTQIQLNFRMDLREWDRYLEDDYRTTDEPFARPLGDLQSILTTIQALRDDNAIEITLGVDTSTSD
jgi:hypothetical protein